MQPEERKWRFPCSDYGEVKGINDAGVETFNSNSLRSLVRESIQNSLDASRGGTVHVEFENSSIPLERIPGADDLHNVLLMCHREGKEQGNSDTLRFFEAALDSARRPLINIMRVSDYGTTGLRGADTCATGTDWSRLIKESGSSSKGGKSGGSFGIGKYSSFACSDFRTVFFSSLDDAGVESHVGVSRLISFRASGGDQYTMGVGYYSESEKNVAIPGQIEFGDFTHRAPGDSGTDIFVVGFKCFGDVSKDIIKYVLIDFLVSIWKGKLSVAVNGTNVNKENLGRHVGELNEYDDNPFVRETIEHYTLLTSSSPSVRVIEFDPENCRGVRRHRGLGWSKGDCHLYLMEGGESLNREVTYTRAAGMRLFNQNRISGSIRFTGILMIEGEKMNRDFKEMEAPSHDEWSAERAQDPKLAAKMIKLIRNWVKDTVTECFQIKVDDEVEAFGTALYLPKREPGGVEDEKSDEESLDSLISEVRQKELTPVRDTRYLSLSVGVTPDAEGDAIRKGKGHGKGTEARMGSAPGEDAGFTRVKIRERLICLDKATGRYKLTFSVPHDASSARLCLNIQGEKDSEPATIVDADAFVGTSRGATFKGNKITLRELKAGEKAEVVFSTNLSHYCMMGADYYEAK